MIELRKLSEELVLRCLRGEEGFGIYSIIDDIRGAVSTLSQEDLTTTRNAFESRQEVGRMFLELAREGKYVPNLRLDPIKVGNFEFIP